uniref:Uncharacterized protein n=1 Tax=Chromera velia CCMP2878 TaxID=1169474 RepID=A0A0G4F0P4_9ALVE|eukprot:Cvel_2585.t1-p1 / transcript=Cvel_2585.t1 / gene=Cvel_2585 / organism=Chromera_velia_CCMP2878 / gene_product=hypothetical protein / transcript_product=hypothetical protein / location=Cvel_scaffold102:88600-90069(+) / protein_length=277 / sequence_SO=supercontig / SO=protein_coding / is_pseudo=false
MGAGLLAGASGASSSASASASASSFLVHGGGETAISQDERDPSEPRVLPQDTGCESPLEREHHRLRDRAEAEWAAAVEVKRSSRRLRRQAAREQRRRERHRRHNKLRYRLLTEAEIALEERVYQELTEWRHFDDSFHVTPCCGHWFDYDACAAVTCDRHQLYFCPMCLWHLERGTPLKEQSRQVHAHVRKCPLHPNNRRKGVQRDWTGHSGSSLFVTREQCRESQDYRKGIHLIGWLKAKTENLRVPEPLVYARLIQDQAVAERLHEGTQHDPRAPA